MIIREKDRKREYRTINANEKDNLVAFPRELEITVAPREMDNRDDRGTIAAGKSRRDNVRITNGGI